MGPSPSKGSLSGSYHVGMGWVLPHEALHVGLDGCDDSPAALRRVFEMFVERVITVFPAIHILLA